MDRKIKLLFEKAKVDAILLRTFPESSDAAFFYFSKLPFGFLSNNFLLLRSDVKPLLLRTVLDPEIKSRNLRIKAVKRRKEMKVLLKKELKGKRIGINKTLYPLASFYNLKKEIKKKKFVDISAQLNEIMAIKEPYEIERVAKAVKITERALNALPGIFRRNITEKELALRISAALREKSKDELAFPTIVADARNSSFPHHVPSNKKIKKGILLVDCGARYKGYCADLTRVFSVGEHSRKERELYATVYEAKSMGENLAVEGANAASIFKKISSFLKKQTGKELVHGLGHGLGLRSHDSPAGFLQESKDILARNMVLTVEPAVYLKNFGIRIEDDIVIGKKACRKLSNAPKELISL